MDIWQYLLVLALGLLLVFLACLAPERFFRGLVRLGLNAAAGLALLIVINALAGATGLLLPLNGLTLAVCSLLGAPGLLAVAAIAAV